MHTYSRGDTVQHKDGRIGIVERVQMPTITVQFPYHWRSSVIKAENISPYIQDEDTDEQS
jgi:hypothetical protein